jgi:hypothetical protein
LSGNAGSHSDVVFTYPAEPRSFRADLLQISTSTPRRYSCRLIAVHPLEELVQSSLFGGIHRKKPEPHLPDEIPPHRGPLDPDASPGTLIRRVTNIPVSSWLSASMRQPCFDRFTVMPADSSDVGPVTTLDRRTGKRG